MNKEDSLSDCYITKVSFFSESSASIHIIREDGFKRVLALSFVKKHNYDLSVLTRSICALIVRSTAKGSYLSRLEVVHTYLISSQRLYLMLYVRDIIDFFAQEHFSYKIFAAYTRFLKLLSSHESDQYFYYALTSFQLMLLQVAGLGSAGDQIRQCYIEGILSLDEVESFNHKVLSKRSFLKIQEYLEDVFEQHIGYSRPKGYFKSWSPVI